MFNFRFIIRILGVFLFIESIALAFSALIPLYYRENDWTALLISAVITMLSALLLFSLGKKHNQTPGKRDIYLVVSVCWILFSLFGMLPFLIHGSILTVTDAFFETISGFSTTGASILTNIESVPHGLLFWRSLTQWLGGMGIIVLSLAILPYLSTKGATMLFNAEAPGMTHDKLKPRIEDTAKRLWAIYVALTLILTLLLWIGPMTFFDAVCHAFTTMATGGFGTKNTNIGFYQSAYVEYVLAIFLFIAGTNFNLIYFSLHGNYRKLLKDDEFRLYLYWILGITLIVAIGLYFGKSYDTTEACFRNAFFNVMSLASTCGFGTVDYVQWGAFYGLIFIIIMIIGASSGSTSGAMKVVRLKVIIRATINEFRKILHPNQVTSVRINDTAIRPEIIAKTMVFAFMYVSIIFVSTLVLTAQGCPLNEALGSVTSCLGGVGPGLGRTGPIGNYAHLQDLSKWLLSLLMLTGRLEIFTFIVIFAPEFWKR